MLRTLKQEMFNGIVYDVAPGNLNTAFHCVSPDTKDTYVVMCGMTIMTKDGEDI